MYDCPGWEGMCLRLIIHQIIHPFVYACFVRVLCTREHGWTDGRWACGWMEGRGDEWMAVWPHMTEESAQGCVGVNNGPVLYSSLNGQSAQFREYLG